MKKNLALAILALGIAFFTNNSIQAGRGGAFAGGFFAGALTGAAIANASSYDTVYYDSPVYEMGYPEMQYGWQDYPTYTYYPRYGYTVEIPAYMYPAGYYYAY